MPPTLKAHPKDSIIYLCAPVNALVEGIYEENVPLSDVLEHGDFGIGTFDDLDGEMLIVDGRIFQILVDGAVMEVSAEKCSPFATVTFFEPSRSAQTAGIDTYDAFLRWLNGLLPSPNLFYALRIEGTFVSVRARSVPKTANYHPFADLAHEQVIFNFHDMAGTLAGFYTPDFMSSLSVPGLHLHFISEDRRHGGHLLGCVPGNVTARIQIINKLELSLPMSEDFLTWDFHRNTDRDLDAVER